MEVPDIKKLKDHPIDHSACTNFVLPVRDTLDIINGKWKLPIIGALMFGNKRFKELQRHIPRITPRMLSKELRELEMNQLVKRTVYDTIPVSVEYELTKHGRSLQQVMKALYEWGTVHRKKITGKK
jgi:DNA-binding HxlR family transcriptional regulator